MIKLTDIKTELFTRTTLTDYGVRFETLDKITAAKYNYDKSYFMITIHILKEDGSINLQITKGNHLTAQQNCE